MKVVALCGSARKEGNTEFLLRTMLGEIEKSGIETEIVNLHQVLSQLENPFCTACSSPCSAVCYKGTELEKLFERITKADALIVGSPVYFGSPTAQTKAFFDKTRAVRGKWIGKIGAAVSCGNSRFGGQELTIRTIHDMFLVCGMTIVGDGQSEFDAGHHGVAAQAPSKEDETAIQRAIITAKRICETIKK